MDERPNKQPEFDEEHLANGETPEQWVKAHEEEIKRQAAELHEFGRDRETRRRFREEHLAVPSEDEVIDGISYFLMWIGYWTAIGFAIIGDSKNAILVGIYSSVIRLVSIVVVNLLRRFQP